MDEIHLDHSGIWRSDSSDEPVRIEPEAIIIAIAWLLALVQIGMAVVRGETFGPDRAVAVAFALGCPLLARESLLELARKLAARRRRR